GYYLNALSQCLGVLLACNRFTAILFSSSHAHVCLRLKLQTKSILKSLHMKPSDMQREMFLNMVLITIICTAFSLIVYGSCLIRLCFFSSTRNSKIERNFFIVGLSSLIFSLPYMAAMVKCYS
ncbi:hypothetical protein PMAYCL1PPCAC_32844, partial [Pristionchus mayeri]